MSIPTEPDKPIGNWIKCKYCCLHHECDEDGVIQGMCEEERRNVVDSEDTPSAIDSDSKYPLTSESRVVEVNRCVGSRRYYSLEKAVERVMALLDCERKTAVSILLRVGVWKNFEDVGKSCWFRPVLSLDRK